MTAGQIGSPGIYLAIYSFIFFTQGLLTGTLGPVIPYLSQERNVPETQYSFLFAARTLGSLLGYLIYKFMQKKNIRHLEHKLIVSGSAAISVFLVVFVEWKSSLGAAISMAVFGTGQYFIFASGNICIFLVAQHRSEKLMITIHAFFGVGALLVPQIMRLLQTNVYYLVFLSFLTCTGLCLYYVTPTLHEGRFKEKNLSSDQTFLDAPFKLEILIGLGLFLISGIEMTVAGWVPTYSVNKGVFTKEEATIYGTLFWGTSTLLRFMAAALTVKASLKLKTLLVGIFICGIICFALDYWQSFYAAAMLGSIGYGLSCSALFPLILSISTQFNIKFRPEQVSNLLLGPIISTGLSTGITGALMQLEPSLLYCSLQVMSAGLGFTSLLFFRVMSKINREGHQKHQKLLEQELAGNADEFGPT